MGRDCSKASGNVYFEARKAAAEYDDRLYSREKAAELLGVSVSTLADYENGNTKFVPVDKVVLMADLYHQPELKTGYCKHECPIGACMPFCTKTSSIAMAALKVLKGLDDSKIDSLRHRIIDVAADGQVDASEKPELAEILKNVDEIALAMNEVRLVCEKELGYDEFAQDYSIFIADRFASVWNKALGAGAQAQPIIGRLSSFHFETQNPGVANWINSRSAQFVTRCSEQQKEAIRALLANKVVESHTVDELARLIRPCVGLTAAQSAATVKYYDSVLSALKSEHPRMKADTVRKKALTAASRYAEKAHRYRAMTIAQTELATAYNQGADEGIRQAQAEGLLGPMLKVWRTSGDDAVCDMCAALDGTEIGMDDSFAYAGKLLFPEQRPLPPAHPRCACAVEYIESPVFRYA